MNNKIAIILAAGSGARFNSNQPKQFLSLNHRPILQYSLDLFVAAGFSKLLFVGNKTKISENLTTHLSISYVDGGESRQASVYKALQFIAENWPDADEVYIHDSARPLVTKALLDRVALAVGKGVGVVPVIESPDSLVHANGDYLVRSDVKLVQTPQGFPIRSLWQKHQLAKRDEQEFSDDGSLFKFYGGDVKFVNGEVNNLKITSKKDFLLAELLISSE